MGAADGAARLSGGAGVTGSGTVPRREPRRENPLGHWRGAASIPPCTWPSAPRGAPSSAGLWGMGVINVLLALGADADSGGAALLGSAFSGGAVGGAEDALACCSTQLAACWTSTAEAHAAALVSVVVA
eukprot:scaffold7966_cov51-Phaeocystis_antarctica.AAC.5